MTPSDSKGWEIHFRGVIAATSYEEAELVYEAIERAAKRAARGFTPRASADLYVHVSEEVER